MSEATSTSPLGTSSTSAPTTRAIIDVDVHHYVGSIRTLLPYMSQRWQRYIEESGFQGPSFSPYPKGSPGAERLDAFPPNGGPAGADLPFLREQLLDTWGIQYAIL